MLGIIVVESIVIEGRQGANDANHDSHRMRVPTEALIKLDQLLMHHRVLLDGGFKIRLLLGVRQLTVLEQVSHFKEVALVASCSIG
jgi:hypothetical protein